MPVVVVMSYRQFFSNTSYYAENFSIKQVETIFGSMNELTLYNFLVQKLTSVISQVVQPNFRLAIEKNGTPIFCSSLFPDKN